MMLRFVKLVLKSAALIVAGLVLAVVAILAFAIVFGGIGDPCPRYC